MLFDINLTILFLGIFSICVLLYLFFSFKNSYFCRLIKSEKDLAFELVDEIIIVYRSSKLVFQINDLQLKYDIDKDSEVNAINTFNKEINSILTNSCKDIINNYLSTSLKDTLDKYVTEDFMIMYIVMKLSSN